MLYIKSIKEIGDKYMRTENIEVTFKIPIPVDKPDLNGVIYSKEAIRNAYKNVKNIPIEMPCSFGDYIFIYPESTQDIKDEATMQNNCVASYIDKVIDGECHILFLRKKNKPDESLVTIEVRNNHIVQARRRFNDEVTAEDQKAIDAFNKKFANKEDKAA